MNCAVCGNTIEKGQERKHLDRMLCEDCYMDALSPARACDPWAVYTARHLPRDKKSLTEPQRKILQVLEDTGGAEPAELAVKVGLTPAELEREIAALRHMEKVRGRLEKGKKLICLWDAASAHAG